MSTSDDTAPAGSRQPDATPSLAGVSFDLASRINPLLDSDLGETALNVAEALDFIAVAKLAHLTDHAGDGLYRWLGALATTLRVAEALEREGATHEHS